MDERTRQARDEPAGIPGPADHPTTPVSAALPEEAVLTSNPLHDDGTLVPDQLHDAPEYVPGPVGMMPGTIMPPIDPTGVTSSAWITTKPSRRPRSIVSVLITIGAVAIGLAVLAILLGMNLNLFSPRGEVVFRTTGSDDVCSTRDRTSSVTTRDTVYYAAYLRGSVGPTETVALRVTRNGQEVTTDDIPPNGTAFDCFGLTEPMGPFQPGVYLFEVLRAGQIDATGTLTVT